jgi:hypothetical protein
MENYFQQGCQDYRKEKGQSSQQMVLGKLAIHKPMNETGFLLYSNKK